MLKTDKNLSETDIRTIGSEQTVLRASTRDRRAWIADAPVCGSLSRHKILHIGVATMEPPFEIVRAKLGGSYFLAGLKGRGRVLVDGRWKMCSPGQAFLLSPGTLHAFHALPEQAWRFCWVRFQEDALSQPVAEANSPVLAAFDGESLRHAILGLHREATVGRRTQMEVRWLELVHRYVHDFAEPRLLDPRLHKLFRQVGASLGESWSNARMARAVHVGERQLERLCLKQLGRTPRQHLIWLRMHRAAELLSEGSLKVEAVAGEVGYANPFVFSTTFKRCMGWKPSSYPGLGATSAPARSSS
tara:strand:- start:120 stop:1025 length:906 start_codon:yes stop_codon:yes gene_type:complete